MRCESSEGQVRIAVSDRGVGIPEADLAMVTRRFFRAGRRPEMLRGFGSGPLDRERHRGGARRSSIDSQPPGRGDHGDIEPAGVHGSAIVKCLLLVDDDPDVLEALAELLTDRYRVLVASSGDVALQTLARQDVDLIVADLMMPIMDGGDVIQDDSRRRSRHAGDHLLGGARSRTTRERSRRDRILSETVFATAGGRHRGARARCAVGP